MSSSRFLTLVFILLSASATQKAELTDSEQPEGPPAYKTINKALIWNVWSKEPGDNLKYIRKWFNRINIGHGDL